MSLTASVMCQCLDAIVVPTKFEPYLHINDDGFLCIQLPVAGNEKCHNQFEAWIAHACEHEDMCLKQEPVASEADLQRFQHLLQDADPALFPTLLRETQCAHKALTPATAAKQMLSELGVFDRTVHSRLKTVLWNSETAISLWEYIPEYGSEMQSSSIDALSLGVDAQGFFIQSDTGVEQFRSQRFTQTLGDDPSAVDAQVVYTDDASGQCFECHTAITGKRIRWPNGAWQNDAGQIRFEYPVHLHTESKPQAAEDLTYITDALKVICLAAVETGNPIRWQLNCALT